MVNNRCNDNTVCLESVLFRGLVHCFLWPWNLFVEFVYCFFSPPIDPETDGPLLPSIGADEYRPFVRKLPEFKFWYATTRAFLIAIVCTFIDLFNIPVFWPILLFYFIILFAMTMKREVQKWIKYGYLPFDIGKPKYSAKTTKI